MIVGSWNFAWGFKYKKLDVCGKQIWGTAHAFDAADEFPVPGAENIVMTALFAWLGLQPDLTSQPEMESFSWSVFITGLLTDHFTSAAAENKWKAERSVHC